MLWQVIFQYYAHDSVACVSDGKAPEQILASKHSVKKYYWMNPSDVTQPPLHATVSYMKRLVQNLASPRPWKPRNLKHSL
jgi:hypothetical protein